MARACVCSKHVGCFVLLVIASGPFLFTVNQHFSSLSPRERVIYSVNSAKHSTRVTWWRWGPGAEGNVSGPGRLLKFIHIPKNAGTTMVRVLKKAGLNAGLKGNSLIMPDGLLCQLGHTPPWYAPAPYEGAETVCIVRHPFTKLLSEYGYSSKRNYGCLTPKRESVRFLLRWGCGDPQSFKFARCTQAGLNWWLQSVIERFNRGLRYFNDCHAVPQTEYIFGRPPLGRPLNESHRTCKHVLKIENLTWGFYDLARRFGLPESASDVRNTTRTTWGTACTNLTVNDIAEDNRRELRRIYADDFALLGYD